MVKTADAVSQACSRIDVDPGCLGTWYDLGSELTSLTGTKMTREVGSVAVFGDLYHVIAGGKVPPLTVTVSGVYSEVPTEAFELVKTLWETPGVSDCDKCIAIRWIPKGGTPGDAMYAMLNAQLVGFKYPELDAGSASPITFEFDVYGYISSDTFVS